MQETPFTYGKIAYLSDFTGRAKECAHLEQNFNSLVNTIIISPRRWGKTSLVNHVAETIASKNDKLIICQVDIFNVKSENDFYINLAQAVLKSTANKWEELAENAKQFLSQFVPKLSFSVDMQAEISFGIELDEIKKRPEEIINLAETIAKAKGLKIVVCIDEFQSIAEFDDPLAFQRKLRSHWQRHQQVAYCIYGSKRHMLMEVFANPSMPFYKFGDILFLEKIDRPTWTSFIQKRFADTGKQINASDAELIAQLVDNHPYYVQQLAQQTWLRTDKLCHTSIVNTAHQSICDQLSLLFSSLIETLTVMQINFLKALLMGETALSSSTILTKYKLGTSANVIKIREALLAKDIIDVQAKIISLQDPLFEFWLKREYFKI